MWGCITLRVQWVLSASLHRLSRADSLPGTFLGCGEWPQRVPIFILEREMSEELTTMTAECRAGGVRGGHWTERHCGGGCAFLGG